MEKCIDYVVCSKMNSLEKFACPFLLTIQAPWCQYSPCSSVEKDTDMMYHLYWISKWTVSEGWDIWGEPLEKNRTYIIMISGIWKGMNEWMKLSIIPTEHQSDLDMLFIYTPCQGNINLCYKLQNQPPSISCLLHCGAIKTRVYVTVYGYVLKSIWTAKKKQKIWRSVAICFYAHTCVVTSAITPQAFLFFFPLLSLPAGILS